MQQEFTQHTQHIQQYLNLIIPQLKQHCKDIKLYNITHRIKTWQSFEQKVRRKQYTHPFEQCHDIGGIRIIPLFKDDVAHIVQLINKHYNVHHSVIKENEVNQFSYQAHHIIIKHDKLFVEIQIRTALQDIWAEMEHYTNYKHIGIDKKTLRQVNALAGMLDIVDDQFEQVHSTLKALQQPQQELLSAESLYYFCTQQYPWAHSFYFKDMEDRSEFSHTVHVAKQKHITSIQHLQEALQRFEEQLNKEEQHHISYIKNMQHPKALYERIEKTKHFYSPLTRIKRVLQML
ncbi:MAG: GTP pyrophosphokinase [Candidatus Woesearchaeota archaeon]